MAARAIGIRLTEYRRRSRGAVRQCASVRRARESRLRLLECRGRRPRALICNNVNRKTASGRPPPSVCSALSSLPAVRYYLFHISDTQSLSPDLARALEVMWSHRQESIYDDELSSRGPAPARAPRVSASARGRCDRIVFHRTPARHRRDSRHARRVARRTQRGQCVARPVDGEALWGVGVSVAV